MDWKGLYQASKGLRRDEVSRLRAIIVKRLGIAEGDLRYNSHDRRFEVRRSVDIVSMSTALKEDVGDMLDEAVNSPDPQGVTITLIRLR